MLGPYVSSRRNNESLYKYNDAKLHHAVYRGRIVRFHCWIIGISYLVETSDIVIIPFSLEKIRRRAGKTVGAVSQEFASVVVSDEFDREMEIITPWQGTTPPMIAPKYKLQFIWKMICEWRVLQSPSSGHVIQYYYRLSSNRLLKDCCSNRFIRSFVRHLGKSADYCCIIIHHPKFLHSGMAGAGRRLSLFEQREFCYVS